MESVKLDEPIVVHVRGRDKWSYWTRLEWAFKLLFGSRIQCSFCNTFEACFNDDKFIGLNYLGSNHQIAIGRADMVDIEFIDPIIHMVIDKVEMERRGK